MGYSEIGDDDKKNTVFGCHHFVTCNLCAWHLTECPICKTPIVFRFHVITDQL